jgi:hypothetical protein
VNGNPVRHDHSKLKKIFDTYSWILHLAALCSIAIAQPLFDLLGRNPTFFTANNYRPIDIYTMVVVFCVVVPVKFIVLCWVAKKIHHRVYDGFLFFVITLLTAAIFMPFIKRIVMLPTTAVIIISIIAGIGFAWAYVKSMQIRSSVSVLSLAILVVPAMFLFFSPVRNILYEQSNTRTNLPKVDATTPVVMLVFDEFSLATVMDETHNIDSSRFPNIAMLVRQANWYRNATAVADVTERAVPAILTGRSPDTSTVTLPNITTYPNNLFTLLGGRYDMHVMESVTSMCPPELAGNLKPARPFRWRMLSLLTDASVVYLHILLPREMTGDLPAIDHNWGGFGEKYFSRIISLPVIRTIFAASNDSLLSGNGFTPDRRAQFHGFINTIGNNSDPSLYFMHILLPHYPWEYLPSGKRYVLNSTDINGLNEERWSNDEWAVLSAYQRYLLQAGFVDRMIGELIARLKETEMYDRSLIVMCADHGVSFRPGDYRRPLTETNAPDIIPVPLIFKLPHQAAGFVSDRNVETIDVLPTIVNVLGIQLPWKTEGVSVLDTNIAERTSKRIFGGVRTKSYHTYPAVYNEKYAAVERQHKFFGTGKNWTLSFQNEDYKNLIGKNVAGVTVTQGDHLVWLSNEHAYENVDLHTDYTLTNISGRINGTSAEASSLLAVSVNGIIRTITRTFADGSGDFDAFVPEETFNEGKNSVEVFTLSTHNGTIMLARPKGNVVYKLLQGQHGGEVILSPAGKNIPVISNGIQGALDSVRAIQNRIILLGWAIEYKDSTIPEQLLVFYRNNIVHVGAPRGLDRWDLITDTTWITDPSNMSKGKKMLLNTGFQFEILLGNNEHPNPDDVRVFAVSPHGYATELPRQGTIRSKSLTANFSLLRDDNKNLHAFTSPVGEKILYKPDEIEGSVDNLACPGDSVHMIGWAADVETHASADEILVFDNEKNIAAFSTGLLRLDLIKGYGHDSLRNAGFNYSFPIALIGDSSKLKTLHLFAVLKGKNIASEIPTPFNKKTHAKVTPEEVDHGSIMHRTGDTYYPVKDSSSRIIAVNTMSGGHIVVKRGALDGVVDLVQVTGDRVHVAGWAADIKRHTGVTAVVVFVNDVDMYIFTPKAQRPDIRKTFTYDSLLDVGFDFTIPAYFLRLPSDQRSIRFFAIDSNRHIASELKYFHNYPYK